MNVAVRRAQYVGTVARGYEARRKHEPKWAAEHAAVGLYLDDLPAGATVLDIPVGTGRFMPHYAGRGLAPIGMDVSRDMMGEAAKKGFTDLRRGSILEIPLADNAVEASVCIRLMNWLTMPEVRVALGELTRVTRSRIIVGVRLKTDPAKQRGNRIVHDRDDFEDTADVLGWKIEGETPIQPGMKNLYSIFRLAPYR